ncbi:hypothetical protein [Emticicia sp. BO119]|uniref:hypothetical protein n=1 Tax=Emticicia sp. BO119 TaxID=2757768 RepID=UPI0015F0B2B0|nr:hypothetical protein [Emticicia sp. BO119]MBA4853455.1 hypothetical protein [Emticicia sp. BO119]
MSQNYKLRFDQMKENNPGQSGSTSQDDTSAFYASEGSIRNFCLVWKDGNMDDFPYSYVVHTQFRIGQEKNTMIIELPSKLITLFGYGLTSLFLAFKKQLPQFIYQVDERYAEEAETVVTEIQIEEKS